MAAVVGAAIAAAVAGATAGKSFYLDDHEKGQLVGLPFFISPILLSPRFDVIPSVHKIPVS